MESPIDTLEQVLTEVANLEARDRAGRAHEVVQVRLAFVHAQLIRLEAELTALYEAAQANPAHAAVWEITQAELWAAQPKSFASPAQTLIAGDLDLLRLVEYTAASIARIQERCATLT